MKVRLYYQDIAMNAFSFGETPLKVKPDEAILIREFTFEEVSILFDNPSHEITKEWICSALWQTMNFHPDTMVDSQVFINAGHTSMSVGDYLVFDDGDVRIAAIAGWQEMTLEEISQPNKKV